mgnify:FL=1
MTIRNAAGSRAIKAKGRDAENLVVEFLKDQGLRAACRVRGMGIRDRGDIGGIPGWMIEVKNEAKRSDSLYMAEVERQVENSQEPFGCCIIKRRGTRDVGEWYAEMPVWMLAKIIEELYRVDASPRGG